MRSNLVGFDDAATTEAPSSAVAYVMDDDSDGVLRRSFADLGMSDGQVARGGLNNAIEELARQTWPRLLIVDVTGIDDPMMGINRLAEMCDPSTEVIVVGERNDISLYRQLKSAGVAEYFYKPLVGTVVSRALGAISAGIPLNPSARGGRLVSVIGVRGGVGATTIAVAAAWHIATERERRTVLLDLDAQHGDAALQLDAQPSHALREALDQPDRIDDLFLDRGVANITVRLGLLAALEPLDELLLLNEDAVLQVLQKLLSHYRYVFIDLPRAAALALPSLLHMPGTVLLVSTGSLASARDVTRWREKIGPNTPDRSLLHVLNKHGAEGALPDNELQRILGQLPEVTIPFGRDVAAATNLGTKSLQNCAAIRRGMADLSRHIAGGEVAEQRPLWRRIFG
jgi:pilus assembly protein CpaE